MSRDVITVGSTMRIPLLYRGEYSQWRERFMNYLEEQTDGEAMINSIQNGDQPLPVIAQVSLVGTTQNAHPTLKDLKFWTAEEKKTRKIDRLARSLLIQGLPNDIYSLIDSNETANDLWDALESCVTSDPLALVAEKTNVSKRKEKVVVSSNSEGSGADDFSELKKITALLAKAFNRRNFYSKPTNNNLRTSSTSQSANKKQEFIKTDDKKVDKKADEKKRDMNKVKCYNCKKEGHFAKDCKKAKVKDYNYYKTKMLLDSDQEINENMVFMAQIEKVPSESDQSSSSAEETIAETVHMIMPSKDNLYNGRKGIGFENLSYFEKPKDLRPTLYDEKVIGLGYTPMFLTHSDEALEIEKFKRSRENKIEFAYDYGNLNASYVNEKINFEDDYFQEIINQDFEKIDSLFQQTSSLKPYVPNVILEKIIIDLEHEVMSLLEKEKENLKTIDSLKSNGFELSENAISESKNQSKYNCHVIEKECDKVENPKVITPGMFKLNVSQSVSPTSMLKTSCESNIVESKLKRKRRKRKSSKQNVKQVNIGVSRSNSDFVQFLDLDTFSSVRRSKNSGVIWKKQGSSNTSNVDLSAIVQICLWIINSGCSRYMTGNRALLTNFVEKFLGTVRFGNNDFAVIAGYRDVVIGSMTIKKVYYVEVLGHNLFSVGQFCDKGLEVAFQKSTCFIRNEHGVDLLTGDRLSNLYTIALNEVASNSLTCLLAKASSSQSWLWHQHISYLNFATINYLVKNNLVQGLPKMKFEKDHLCSACEQGKIHWKYHKSKMGFASNKPLYLLHMDLCGPMCVQSINGKRYVLVVVDDYLRYTWVFFLHSKDEASEVILSFIKKTQVNLQPQVQRVRTDNCSEFKNKTLAKFFDGVGITQQFFAARTPQQNGVVERRNRT
nr:retrovirus-related Pol polyprotein from transposon TNT 1-94 [Tanacetum cinerariifolium]